MRVVMCIAALAVLTSCRDVYTRDGMHNQSPLYGRWQCTHVTGLGPIYEFDTQNPYTVRVYRPAPLESAEGFEFFDNRTGQRVVLKDSYGYRCDRLPPVPPVAPKPLPPIWKRNTTKGEGR